MYDLNKTPRLNSNSTIIITIIIITITIGEIRPRLFVVGSCVVRENEVTVSVGEAERCAVQCDE